MITLKKWILSIALVLLAPSAMAAEMFDSWYVATDLGRSKFSNSCNTPTATYTSCKDYDFGQKISTGLLVASYTHAEIGYYDSGKSTQKGAGNISRTIDSVEWQISAMRSQPIGNGRFVAFSRLGLVHWEVSEASTTNRLNTSGNSILLGVGGKFFITKDVAARVQLDTHKVGNSTNTWNGNVYFLSTGLTYQFY